MDVSRNGANGPESKARRVSSSSPGCDVGGGSCFAVYDCKLLINCVGTVEPYGLITGRCWPIWTVVIKKKGRDELDEGTDRRRKGKGQDSSFLVA